MRQPGISEPCLLNDIKGIFPLMRTNAFGIPAFQRVNLAIPGFSFSLELLIQKSWVDTECL